MNDPHKRCVSRKLRKLPRTQCGYFVGKNDSLTKAESTSGPSALRVVLDADLDVIPAFAFGKEDTQTNIRFLQVLPMSETGVVNVPDIPVKPIDFAPMTDCPARPP